MFIGRAWRKKRKVPLLLVPTPQKKLHIMSDRWIPPTRNVPARGEDWFRSVYCSHQAFCGCNDFIRHLAALSAEFGFQPGPSPGGNSGPRATPPVIRNLRALPAAPTTPRPPPCGGPGGSGAGGDRGDAGEGGDLAEPPTEDVSELLDLIEDAE